MTNRLFPGQFFLALLVCQHLLAQLNDKCVVSILNRSVQARLDGTWILPNVPSNFGRVRARATCTENGLTRSGESAYFTLSANQSVDIPRITLGPTTPIPTSITITSPFSQLTPQQRTTQLTVTATYTGAPNRNLTSSSTGTTYTISNRAIATITPDGLVTAVASGAVVIQAANEGTQGLFFLQVVLTGDSDNDGIPDDVEIREGLNPNDPTDALADLDNDGLTNRQELMQYGTQIRNRDTDGDGLSDGEEVNGLNGFTSDPLVVDTDGDGVSDFLETTIARTNPRDATSVNYGAVTTRIDVTPTIFTLTVNTLNPIAFTQLNVIATLTNNTTLDLTARSRGTQYASSDLNICNFGAQDGRVFAGQTGSCNVTVSAAGRTVVVPGTIRTFQPAALSQITIPGYANNVDVQGGYAYVAAGATGLQVVNVSNPATPIIVAARDTAGNANDVRIVGTFAYIADGTNGLVIMNIANPLNPVIVGTVDTPGEAVDVFVSGTFAYIADGGSGLSIANVTNPAAPILVSTTATGGIARGVAVRDNVAVVVCDTTNTFRTYNVTNPSLPVALGSLNLTGSLKDVAISGTLAAVAALTGGTPFVDISNPAQPVLRGTVPSGFGDGLVPRDVEFGIGFAIVSEQLFPNAAGFIDYGTVTSPNRRGILDFSQYGTYAGTGLALSGALVFKTGESNAISQENGVTGNTKLFIGQYLPLEDLAGVPPTVSINAIPGGNNRVQGERITITAEASDDIAVTSVNFLVNGVVAFTDTTAPYEFTYTIPIANQVTLLADGYDLANNRGRSAPVVLNIAPDPLTTVTGRVLDENGTPIPSAPITVTGDFTGTSGSDGRFSISGVTTVNGNISASAVATVNNVELRGSTVAVPYVRGGTTNVGDFRLFSARWETNIGACWSSSDDTFVQVNLPFAFPFYGAARTTTFVGTNGYVTFGTGDSQYTETIPQFNTLPRIAAFFDDLFGRSQGCAHYNVLPDRLVVTYNNVQHYSAGGSNTIQIILFQDGRIQFGYRGITALTTGTITGITPGPNSPAVQLNFSAQPAVDVPAGTAIFEYFLGTNPFDLDGAFILFTPRPSGGYTARTILPVVGAQNVLVSGTATSSGALGAPLNRSALAANDETEVIQLTLRPMATVDSSQAAAVTPESIANAEVEVRASTNVEYKGNTNTDRRGSFAISGVPRGGINVVVQKNGQVVGVGSAVLPPFPTTQRAVSIVVVSPTVPTKP